MAWEVEEWFFSADSHWLFSFLSLCAVLGPEPASLPPVRRVFELAARYLSPLHGLGGHTPHQHLHRGLFVQTQYHFPPVVEPF
jgi:hypothetical protein